MGVLGGLGAEGLEELEVLGGVHEVVFAADDVGHFHGEVVDDVDEMEDVGAVAAFYDHVWGVRGVAVVDGDFAADEVVHGDGLALEAEAPCAVIFVESAGGEEFLKILGVDVVALGLLVGGAWAADFGAFIPVKAEPVHAFEDGFAGFFCVPGGVCVFDTEDEFAVVLTGVEPVEEGGAGAADVEVAGG